MEHWARASRSLVAFAVRNSIVPSTFDAEAPDCSQWLMALGIQVSLTVWIKVTYRISALCHALGGITLAGGAKQMDCSQGGSSGGLHIVFYLMLLPPSSLQPVLLPNVHDFKETSCYIHDFLYGSSEL